MKMVSFKEWREKKCIKCANKNTDLCCVKRNIDNSVNCVYYEDTKEKEE